MTVIEFAGISDFIGCDQKYENSYSEVLRFIRERMTFRVYTSVRDKFYLILVFVFIIPVGLSAQNAYIQGVVQDIDGTPLAGAVVMLMRDGTRVAATTCKINGTFKISAHILQTDVLQVSFVGFRNRQIPVSAFTDWNNIRIILRETVIQLDDVTVMSPSRTFGEYRYLSFSCFRGRSFESSICDGGVYQRIGKCEYRITGIFGQPFRCGAEWGACLEAGTQYPIERYREFFCFQY